MTRAAFEQEILSDSILAAAALTAYQYYPVKQDSSGTANICAVAGEKSYGILQNAPASGEACDIMILGISTVTLGGTVVIDDPLTVNSSGTAVVAVNEADFVFGRALSDGVSGDDIPVFVHGGIGDVKGEQTVQPGFTENFDYGASKGLAILQADGTAYDATADVHNVMQFGSGNKIMCVPIVGQTIPPAMSATGLNIAGDVTDNDGFMLYSNNFLATGRPFIIGLDPAFYFALTFTLANVDGTDECHVGFRRAETTNATIDNYLDMAALCIEAATSPALIHIETILNNGGTTTVDTTDTLADATSTVWRINVSAAGVVTFLIDGVAPTATSAFTFDDGDPVIPFLDFLQANAAQTGAFNLTKWEVGFQ